MDEIIKSIKAFLYDRTVSPLIGAFVLAWLTWNYRVVIVVFDSGATFVEKMSFFDAYFADEYQFQIAGYAFQMIGGGHMVHGFLAPALLTWFYIYIYPKLAEPVYFVSLRNLKRLRELKNTQENLRLLTMEESRNLQKEIEQLRYKADEEAANYRARIASLTETINSLESNQNKTKTSSTENFLAELVGPTSTTERLINLVSKKIEELPDGKFRLLDLFAENDWVNLNEQTKKIFEASFKEIIESRKFPEITFGEIDSDGQRVYLKNRNYLVGLEEEFERQLNSEYSGTTLAKVISGQSGKKLVAPVIRYFIQHDLTLAMFNVLYALVVAGGRFEKEGLQRMVGRKLSGIEIDHLLKKLEHRKLIKQDDYRETLYLTDLGKEMAVESGLTSLAKAKLNN